MNLIQSCFVHSDCRYLQTDLRTCQVRFCSCDLNHHRDNMLFFHARYLDFESVALHKMTNSRTVFRPSAQQKSKSKFSFGYFISTCLEQFWTLLKFSQHTIKPWTFLTTLALATVCLLKSIIYLPRTIRHVFCQSLIPCLHVCEMSRHSQEAHSCRALDNSTGRQFFKHLSHLKLCTRKMDLLLRWNFIRIVSHGQCAECWQNLAPAHRTLLECRTTRRIKQL